MGNGPTTAQVVGSTAGRSRHHDSVPLYDSPEDIVDVNVKSTHELAFASCNGDFIESMALRWRILGLSIRVDIHLLISNSFSFDCVFNGAGQAGSELNCDLILLFCGGGECRSIEDLLEF